MLGGLCESGTSFLCVHNSNIESTQTRPLFKSTKITFALLFFDSLSTIQMNILGGTAKTNGLLSRNILRISYGFQWFSMVLNGSSMTYRFENPSEHMFRF
jgi:hypothetical protein